MTKRRRYSPEEIERGLTALILAGSSPKASQVTGVPEETLRTWKSERRDQYDRLSQDLEPQVVQRIAAEAEGIVLRLANVQHDIIDRVEATIHELKPSEAHAAARNMATVSALYVDKHSSPLRERPSHVQQTQDLDSMVKQMARLMGFDATTTAIDVTDEPTALPLKAESDDRNALNPAA